MNALREMLKHLTSDSCLLCGGKPTTAGVFVPDKPEAWGAAKGKGRIFRYSLCSECNQRTDKAEAAEKVIRSELAGGGIIHE